MVVLAGPGNDTIFIEGADGYAQISGGAGDDTFTVLNSASSYASGGDGNDTFNGGASYDSFDGGDGDDIIYGGGERDHLSGGDGDDIIYGGYGDDHLDGGDGDDTIYGSNGGRCSRWQHGCRHLVRRPRQRRTQLQPPQYESAHAIARLRHRRLANVRGPGNDTLLGSDRWDRMQAAPVTTCSPASKAAITCVAGLAMTTSSAAQTSTTSTATAAETVSSSKATDVASGGFGIDECGGFEGQTIIIPAPAKHLRNDDGRDQRQHDDERRRATNSPKAPINTVIKNEEGRPE